MPVKKRREEEEVARMAMVEARLVIADKTDSINQEIMKELAGGSIEAIKGKRRLQSCKKRVEVLVRALMLDAETSIPPPWELAPRQKVKL